MIYKYKSTDGLPAYSNGETELWLRPEDRDKVRLVGLEKSPFGFYAELEIDAPLYTKIEPWTHTGREMIEHGPRDVHGKKLPGMRRYRLKVNPHRLIDMTAMEELSEARSEARALLQKKALDFVQSKHPDWYEEWAEGCTWPIPIEEWVKHYIILDGWVVRAFRERGLSWLDAEEVLGQEVWRRVKHGGPAAYALALEGEIIDFPPPAKEDDFSFTLHERGLDYEMLSRHLGDRTAGWLYDMVIRRNSPWITLRWSQVNFLAFHQDGTIRLNSGGQKTAEMKLKLNFNLPDPWYIIVERATWRLCSEDESYPFRDNMRITPGGEVEGQASQEEEKEANRLAWNILVYAEDLARAMAEGQVELPAEDDCCLHAEQTDQAHLLGHIESGEMKVSLALRAINRFPVGYETKSLIDTALRLQQPVSMEKFRKTEVALAQSIKRYLRLELGLTE